MKPLDTLRVGIACDHAGYTLKEELKSIFGKQTTVFCTPTKYLLFFCGKQLSFF